MNLKKYNMPNEKGIWTQEEADSGHLFSNVLARIIAGTLNHKKRTYDVGCGNAAYVRFLEEKGFEDVIGIEGLRLENFKSQNVIIQDLTLPFELETKGNVICLEVAEHIPAKYEYVFLKNVTSLVGEGGFIFLSWAVEGQEGIGHVNCKSNEYVIEKMGSLGFKYLEDESLNTRILIEEELSYFKNTLMIFIKL